MGVSRRFPIRSRKVSEKNMSEELTLLQKLMTSKPPTRWITMVFFVVPVPASSKPPTRWITNEDHG